MQLAKTNPTPFDPIQEWKHSTCKTNYTLLNTSARSSKKETITSNLNRVAIHPRVRSCKIPHTEPTNVGEPTTETKTPQRIYVYVTYLHSFHTTKQPEPRRPHHRNDSNATNRERSGRPGTVLLILDPGFCYPTKLNRLNLRKCHAHASTLLIFFLTFSPRVSSHLLHGSLSNTTHQVEWLNRRRRSSSLPDAPR